MLKILPIIIAIIVIAGVGVLLYSTEKEASAPLVTNFEECVQAGNPVMESYPRQCRHEGETFVEIIDDIENPNPDPRIAGGFIAGHIDIGPNCPVEQEGVPCPVPPEAYSSREIIVYEKDGTTVRERGKINAQGDFNIPIGPGDYFVQVSPAGIGEGEKKPVKVISFETTTINFDIDTGIR